MLFTTTIRAINPQTGELCTWTGPNVPGICFSDAQAYCDNNQLGYCKVDGILESIIDWDGNKTQFRHWN